MTAVLSKRSQHTFKLDYALPTTHSVRRLSPDRSGIALFFLQLSATCLPRVNFAASRIHLSAVDHAGVCLDGQYAPTYLGYQSGDSDYRGHH